MLIEQSAYSNRWRGVSPSAKGLFALFGLIAAFAARTPIAAGVVAGLLAVAALLGARVLPGRLVRVAAPALGFLLIGSINPDYKPWFSSLIEPASGEIASLLFALQAALGAGVIGYWLGVSVTREKMRRETEQKKTESRATEGETSRC